VPRSDQGVLEMGDDELEVDIGVRRLAVEPLGPRGV
jgi:hypothetical protein